MLVDRTDGTCASCEGQLEIINADDISMTVQCTECDEGYGVEPDAFGDGCVEYYIPFMTQQYLASAHGGE